MVVVLVKVKLAILFEAKQYLLLALLLLWLMVAEVLIILYRMADGLDYVQYWHMRELLLVRLVMDSDLVLETEGILPVQIPLKQNCLSSLWLLQKLMLPLWVLLERLYLQVSSLF